MNISWIIIPGTAVVTAVTMYIIGFISGANVSDAKKAPNNAKIRPTIIAEISDT